MVALTHSTLPLETADPPLMSWNKSPFDGVGKRDQHCNCGMDTMDSELQKVRRKKIKLGKHEGIEGALCVNTCNVIASDAQHKHHLYAH